MAEKKIAGRTVRYDRLPADEGLKMLLRVLKVLGPARGIIEAIASENEAQSDMLAMQAIASFTSEMDSEAVFSLIMDMVKACHVDGTPAVPGIMDLKELLSVAMFALQTEFGGFFDEGVGSVLQRAVRAALASPHPRSGPSPPTSPTNSSSGARRAATRHWPAGTTCARSTRSTTCSISTSSLTSPSTLRRRRWRTRGGAADYPLHKSHRPQHLPGSSREKARCGLGS